MRIYLRDYLSKSGASDEAVTSAFHYFDKSRSGNGYMIGLISSRSPNSYDSSNINRFVWNGIVDQFSESEGGSIDRLRKSLKSGKSKMIELIKNGALGEDGVDLNFSLLHFVGDTIYFGYFGSAQIHIFHEDELVDVTAVLDKSNVNVGSTNISPSDLIILNSANFWELNPSLDKSENLVEMLLEKIDNAVVKDGTGVIMASLGLDFEKILAVSSGPEIIDRSTTTLPTVVDLEGDVEEVEESVSVATPISPVSPVSPITPVVPAISDVDEDPISPDTEISETDESVDSNDSIDQDEIIELAEESIEEDIERDLETTREDNEINDPREESAEDIDLKVDEKDDRALSDDPDEDPFRAFEYEESLHEKSDIDPQETVFDTENPPEDGNTQEKGELSIFDKIKNLVNTVSFTITKKFRSIVGSDENRTDTRSDHLGEIGTEEKPQSRSNRNRNVSGYLQRYLFNPHGRRIWMKKAKARMSQAKLRNPSLKGMKLGGYKDKADMRKRWLIVLGGLILVAVVFLGVRQASILREQMRVSKNFETFYDLVIEDVENAEKVATIDPEAASLALLDFDRKLEEASVDAQKLGEKDREKYDSLLDKVLGITDKIERVEPMSEEIGNLDVFSEIRININNAKSSDIAIYKDEKPLDHLIVSDPGSRSVYVISTYEPVYIKLPDPDKLIMEPIFVDIGEKGIYIYDAQKGALRSLFGANKNEFQNVTEISGAGKGDMAFDRPEEFTVLTQNDNLYYLDAHTATVYKSSTTSGGSYSLPTTFISDQNLLSATDLFADFSVYVTADGSSPFNRYISSAGEFVNSNLAFRGVNGDVEGISAGYTGGDLNKILFLFNPHTKRIMLFEKPNEGEGRHPGELHLIKQYEYRGERDDAFADVKDIVASTEDDLLYILDGDTIWKLKIER